MAKQPTGIVIRFANDINRWRAAAVTDANTGQAVVIPTGADLVLQMFFSQGAISEDNKLDYTGLLTVYVSLQSTSSPHAGTIYWHKAIDTQDVNNICTVADWQAGSDQQIQMEIPNSLNAFQAPQGQQNYWLVVYAVTDEATPRQIVFCAAQVQVVDSGLPVGVPTLPAPFKIGSKISFACADGQTRDVNYAQLAGGRWVLEVGQTGYLGGGLLTYSLGPCADGLFRDLSLVLVDGVWTLDVGQEGHS